MEAKDIKVKVYPEPKQHGMSAPYMSKGIKITHLPTGNIVVCQQHRTQHQNKESAIAAIKAMIDKNYPAHKCTFEGIEGRQGINWQPCPVCGRSRS